MLSHNKIPLGNQKKRENAAKRHRMMSHSRPYLQSPPPHGYTLSGVGPVSVTDQLGLLTRVRWLHHNGRIAI